MGEVWQDEPHGASSLRRIVISGFALLRRTFRRAKKNTAVSCKGTHGGLSRLHGAQAAHPYIHDCLRGFNAPCRSCRPLHQIVDSARWDWVSCWSQKKLFSLYGSGKERNGGNEGAKRFFFGKTAPTKKGAVGMREPKESFFTKRLRQRGER